MIRRLHRKEIKICIGQKISLHKRQLPPGDKTGLSSTETCVCVLTVRPFVGDGGDGVVPSGVLQRIMCRSIVTRRWCERRAG
jgi:hypothetical protein